MFIKHLFEKGDVNESKNLEIENSANPFEMRVSWVQDVGSDFVEGIKLENKKPAKIE